MKHDPLLPDPPESIASARVRLWRAAVTIPTYEPLAPDRNPMFLEHRVYQGSSGRVYPLPCYGRISHEKTPRVWDAVHLENEYLRVLILPELGGRIHILRDRQTGHDLIYRQDVIKPALVGLAGPWVSGGIEFNWPQHHRPATFMPVGIRIEHRNDGSAVVWLGDHDPMQRMLGVHGVCLKPGVAALDLIVRLYNRTELTQTFLWWANVATRVHERYQSFFPRDVRFVADHARRAMSTFPRCEGVYYGVDYASRAKRGVPAQESPSQFIPRGKYAPNDLSWYANIPVPTSYMCIGSTDDFHGGYDHAAGVGIVHVASHHISPGKKQWTWGNHDFGYAWDRNLTDADESGVHHPYIELMAGVYTDNQPDFSFLAPGETRSFRQRWYPIRSIGPATRANDAAAVSLVIENRVVRVGVCVTEPILGARLELFPIVQRTVDLRPSEPFSWEVPIPAKVDLSRIELRVSDASGGCVIRDAIGPVGPRPTEPASASEPPEPRSVVSTDELYVIGLHLEQYRHATRRPEPYWQEAIRRDPLDSRCNTAMGRLHLRQGEFGKAREHFERALARITSRNANPADSEAYYGLGLTLRWLGSTDEAYASLYKATWNAAWQVPAFTALAEIDASHGRWADANQHASAVLDRDHRHLRARAIAAIALRGAGQPDHADTMLRLALDLEPHNHWAAHQLGNPLDIDASTRIDIAWDYASCGRFDQAMLVLEGAKAGAIDGAAPMLRYHLAYFAHRRALPKTKVREHLRKAVGASPDYCFPSRLEDQRVLQFALEFDPTDARAAFYLGNLLYDRRRYDEAVASWERASRQEKSLATLWRNLGIARFNVQGRADDARRCFARAARIAPADARLLYEQDQLEKRVGSPPSSRLARLARHARLVDSRDDLSVEYATLLNTCSRPVDALAFLLARRFQPWEGGEGQALAQFVRSHLLLGRAALARQDADEARSHFQASLTPPASLGETFHFLANRSDIHFHLGLAHRAGSNEEQARKCFSLAAQAQGDFQQMSVCPYSEMTYFSARAARALGLRRRERSLLSGMLAHARKLGRSKASIDYFATSHPTMLLFNDDLQQRQTCQALLLEGLALLGQGRRSQGLAKLRGVLRLDPSHALARDMLFEVTS